MVVLDCLGHAQIRPHSFVITCADRNDYLRRLRWSVWGPSAAFGRGVEWLNNCTPNCVGGKFIRHNVQVVFWRPGRIYRRHHAVFRFTRLTVGHVTHIL